MLNRGGSVLTRSSTVLSKRTFIISNKPWRKVAYLKRQPVPRPLEQLKIEASEVKHSNSPVTTSVRGQEHVYPVDLDYMHVTPEDERVGLVLRGLHPQTRISEVRNFLIKHSFVRHCWIHSRGVVCARFQDEESKEKARRILQELKGYPFHVYDEERRNWLSLPPEEQPPLELYPLTTSYDQKEPTPGRVLVMRSLNFLPNSVMALFANFNETTRKVQPLATKFQAHDRWIWEYYLRFPTVEKANDALEAYAGKEVTIPYRDLFTADKLQFPYGKTLHLWMRHTGLNHLPLKGTHDSSLKRLLFRPNHPLFSPQKDVSNADK